MLPLLRPPLSRSVFDIKVKTDPKKLEVHNSLKLTESDHYALETGRLKDVIALTQRKYQSDTQMKFDYKLQNKPLLQ